MGFRKDWAEVSGSPLSFCPASPVSEVEDNGNEERSHETVSSGGVQGKLG